MSRVAVRPSSRVGRVETYAPPRGRRPAVGATDRPPLRLDANEGRRPDDDLLARLTTIDAETIRRYPAAATLERDLADRFGIDPACVIVTAGADDAIDRLCRAVLDDERAAVVTSPTFEMIPRYAGLAGATVETVPWLDRPFPEDEIAAACGDRTGAVFVATPNNPTGAAAETDALVRLARAAPFALLVADLAYVEFADVDPTARLLEIPNVVMTRTFSKAWGLAGLRVGYALGPAEIIGWLRRVGHPYPTSSVSLALAAAALDTDPAETSRYIERVRLERTALVGRLRAHGAGSEPSQGNFVLGRFADAWSVADALAEANILVRRFERDGPLGDRLRITCPGNAGEFDRLEAALAGALAATGARS